MATNKKPPAYDPAKRYALTLARVVDVDGIVLRPGPTPPEVDGAMANAIDAASPGAINVATELAPLPEPPAAPSQIHEDADGVQTIVNAA